MLRNQEKLIDDLMFGEENADQILEQHREQVEEQTKKTTFFSHAGKFIPTLVRLFPHW